MHLVSIAWVNPVFHLATAFARGFSRFRVAATSDKPATHI